MLEMYQEEKPHLRPLPLEGFRYFKQGTRTVDDAGLVQIDGAYYAALPATLHSKVTVRIYPHDIEILNAEGQLLRRHAKSERKGQFELREADRLFNPSRETLRLLARVEKIGPNTARLARELFARLGRPAQRALYGLANLPKRYTRADIEAVCTLLFESQCVSYTSVKRALERRAAMASRAEPTTFTQSDPSIHPLSDYQAFWASHSQTNPKE